MVLSHRNQYNQVTGRSFIALGVIAVLVVTAVSPAYAFGPFGKNKKNDAHVESSTTDNEVGASTSDEEKAKIVYNEGVEAFKLAQYHGSKGNNGGQDKLLKSALQSFEAALKLNPSLVEAQSNIGFVYLTDKNYKKAIKAFETALAMDPHHLNTLNGLSTTYAFNNEIDKSVESFNELTKLDPNNAGYLFNKASVLHKAARFDEAKNAYQEALEIEPTHQRSLFNLATLFENQGNLKEAMAYYQRAKGAGVSNPIGLESINRIEVLEQALASEKMTEQSQAKEDVTVEVKTNTQNTSSIGPEFEKITQEVTPKKEKPAISPSQSSFDEQSLFDDATIPLGQ